MEQQYTISGVKVSFPCKAYPTQITMMSRIIQGIEKEQNCLLESPTGSGKSLALLCSCLAWQKGERDKQSRAEAYPDLNDLNSSTFDDDLKKPSMCTCSCAIQTSTQPSGIADDPHTSTSADAPHTSTSSDAPQTSTSSDAPHTGTSVEDTKPTSVKGPEADAGQEKGQDPDDDDDDFQPTKKRSRTGGGPSAAAKRPKRQKGVVFEDDDTGEPPEQGPNPDGKAHWEMKLVTSRANAEARELSTGASGGTKSPCFCPCHTSSSKADKMGKKGIEEEKKGDDRVPKRIPRIYFGTRTHKQIAQIIRELGRTAYKHVRMSILGSREHTCVHPEVSRSRNKNEGCKELLDGKNGVSCPFFSNVHKMKQQWQIRDLGLTEAWDIEDIVALGKRKRACPYFATRALKDEADVIFCPYNYLIDPKIREAMEINLKNQVIVLDEAHNIEDSAREAASLPVTAELLKDTTDELDKLLTAQFRVEHARVMHSVSSRLLQWMNDFSTSLQQNDFDRASRIWSGQEMVAALANMGISPATLGTLQHHLSALNEDEDPERRVKELGPSLSGTSYGILNSLFIIFNFLFKEDMKYTKDYKVALLKTRAKNQFPNTNNRWLHRRRTRDAPLWTLSLNFWCLNPAVAFSDIGCVVRSVILTSGTLSPMTSFASELGVAFPIQLEANHVIGKSQVWVSSVAMGPNGHSLNASYRNTETYAFQDDLGRLVVEVCRVIPYGVLCFVSSYSMMNKLMDRWKATGAYDELQSLKMVMCEARGGDKEVFDEQLRHFYDTIKECEENGSENQQITGVVMFAVCRGKISEGMDFADNNARAVITVGIPYPNVKDAQVELKRKYNDQHAAARGLLTGGEWYEVQAYRALNQALGRCIRHKKDWGALLLVDERFSRNPKKYISGLSKWVRGRVDHHTHFRDALASLSHFATVRMQGSPEPDLSILGSQSSCQSPVPPCDTPSSASSRQATVNHNANPPPALGTPLRDVDSVRRQTHGPTDGCRGPTDDHCNVGQLFVPVSAKASTPGDRERKAASRTTSTPRCNLPQAPTETSASVSYVDGARGMTPTHATKLSFVPSTALLTATGASSGVVAYPFSGSKKLKQQTLLTSPAVNGSGTCQSRTKQQKLGRYLLDRNSSSAQQCSKPAAACGSAGEGQEGAVIVDLTSPDKAGQATEIAVDSHFPTPKAKLKFDDCQGESDRSGVQSAVGPTTIAGKLSRFGYTKQEVKGGGSNHQQLQHQVRSARDGNERLPPVFSDIPSEDGNENRLSVKGGTAVGEELRTLPEGDRTLPGSEEEKEEDEDGGREGKMKRRREKYNSTPDLFDSDVGGSEGEPSISSSHLAHRKCNLPVENSKMGTNNNVLERTDAPNHAACCNGDAALINREEKPNWSSICCEEQPPISEGREGMSSRSRRSLSRRKQDVQQDDPAAVAEPQPTMRVRRSARTRRTPKKVAEAETGTRTKDKTRTKTKDTLEESRGDSVCFEEVCCINCNTPLLPNMHGVSRLTADSCGSVYLQRQLSRPAADGGNIPSCPLARGEGRSCACQSGALPGWSASLVVADSNSLTSCSPFTPEQETGLGLNAYWSEEDQCCFQPIRCDVCEAEGKVQTDQGNFATSPVIGYKLLSAGTSTHLQAGKTYLLSTTLRYCQTALDQGGDWLLGTVTGVK